MAAEKQLIIAVEGTAAVGPFWQTILVDYIEKIVRAFSGGEVTGQKLSDASSEFALVVFNSHGPYCACLVQRSGWTKDVAIFLQWLSALSFSGGGFNESAITEGLSEALLMFSATPSPNQSQQHIDFQKHCILIAGSNPNPLPTPVPRPAMVILDKSDNAETPTEGFLADAEAIARSFPQSFVSLSVVAPKQLPKLRAIYNAGRRNPRTVDPTVDYIKNPQFLVLLSENFLEARLSLNQPGMTGIQPNSGIAKVEGPPSTTSNPVNAPMVRCQTISTSNIPPATVKAEPTTLPSLATSAPFSHLPSVANTTSQGNPTLPTSSAASASQELNTNAESVQEFKPVVNPTPQPRPMGPGAANVSILNSLSQARQVMNASITGGNSIGLNTIGGTSMAMHMSNMISNGMASSGLSTVASSGLSGMATVPGSGALMATAPVGQNSTLSSFPSTVSNIAGNSSMGVTSSLQNIQGMGQSLPGLSQTSLSSVSQMGQNGIGMNQNVMTGLPASNVSSGAGNMMPTPGMSQQIQPGLHPLGPTNGSLGTNNGTLGAPNGSGIMPQQQVAGAQQSQSKYVKIWEGALSGQRQGQPVFICKLEGYRSCTASEKLAEDWPPSMQIVRLISQDHMNNKQYVGKADFLVFRTLNQHGFLGQLQEKKLCAVIQLPSQTLLLSVSEKASRLIGMLFPGDMVVFKPQISSQQQQLQQQQQLHQQTQQLQQQPQQLQQQQLRPQMVGQAMGQTFVQGTGRPQMMPQGMMSQPGQGNMPTGGGFMP